MSSFGSAELVVIFFILVGLITLPMFIVSLIQCLSAQFQDSNNKIVWVLVILMLPFIGPILWWAVGMKQRRLG